MDSVVIDLGDAPVRFTPNGEVSVLDAIAAVTGTRNPQPMWEAMTSEHPGLLDHCRYRALGEENGVTVVDGEGWDRIWSLLPEFLIQRTPG